MFKTIYSSLITLLFAIPVCHAQNTVKYDLKLLLTQHKLFINPHSSAEPMMDGRRQGVSCTGVVWITGSNFSTGTIDVDLRGRDVFQQSFLGIAFHGVDSVTYDAIYFRPFNFHSPDTLRRKHMVQYIAEPKYPWDTLRAKYPLVYEHGIASAPLSADWFHVHIVVTDTEVKVYVNHSKEPSLTVKKLNDRSNGMLGLFDDSLPGDFANLEVKNR